MAEQGLDRLVELIRTWQFQRTAILKRLPYQEGSNSKSLTEFVEVSGRIANRVISLLEVQDEDFFSAMAEIANVAVGNIHGGKTFVNGQDRTQEARRG
jgi:hypothetical protein